jgi:hypothetical protein
MGEKYTVVGGHVGCRSAVHYPRRRPLHRQLVEGSDQAGSVPATWSGAGGGKL